MFARDVFMHLKPRALRSLRGTIENEIIPLLRNKKASRTKSPSLPRA